MVELPELLDELALLLELLAAHGRDPDAFGMDTMIDYSLSPPVWAEQAAAWEASGGSILCIRTMSTGARYHGVPDVQVGGPAAHIAALGEFLRVVRG